MIDRLNNVRTGFRTGRAHLILPVVLAIVIGGILLYILTRDGGDQPVPGPDGQNTETSDSTQGTGDSEDTQAGVSQDNAQDAGQENGDMTESAVDTSKLVRIFGKVTDAKGQPIEKAVLRWATVPADRRETRYWSNDGRILQADADPAMFPEGKLRDAFAKSILTESEKDGTYEIQAPETDMTGIVIAGGLGYGTQVKALKEVRADGETDKEEAAEKEAPAFAEEIELNFELKVGFSISGRVTDKLNRKPVSAMAVLAGMVEQDSMAMLSFVKPDAPSTMTDGDGRYILQGLPPGDYRIIARTAKSHYVSIPSKEGIRLTLDQNYTDVDLEVIPGGTLFGVVTDPEGSPVAGGRCIAMPTDYMTMAMQGNAEQLTLIDGQRIRTGAEGLYEIKGLALDREYSIRCEFQGFAQTRSRPVKLTREKPEAEVNVVLKTGVSVSGTVVYEDDSPAPKTRVELRTELQDMMKGNVFNKSASSDENGAFFFGNIPPGEYVLGTERTSSANMFLESKGNVRITVKEDEDLSGIALVAKKKSDNSISGMVVDNDGTPVPKVNINVFSAHAMIGLPPSRGVTKDDGTFVVRGLDDSTFRVKAIKSGYTVTTMREVQANTQDLTIIIDRYGTISGRVLLPGGGPIPSGGKVKPRVMEKESMKATLEKITEFQMLEQISAPINEDGTFTVNAPVGDIVVRAFVTGFAPGESKVFKVSPAQDCTGARIALTVGAVIHGKVVLADNTPVEGAAVTVERSEELEQKNMFKKLMPQMFGKSNDVSTNADGHYEVAHLAEGEYSVIATHPDYSPSEYVTVIVKTDQAAEAEPLVLFSGGRITGKARDANGPRVGLMVQVIGTGFMQNTTTGKDGGFSFKGIKRGAYMVQFIDIAAMQKGKMTMKVESIAIEDNQLVEIDMVFGVGHKISGTVEGLPPAPFNVVQLRRPGGILPEELDPLDIESQMKDAKYQAGIGMVMANGKYEIIDVEPGEYFLEIPKMPKDPTDMEAYAKMKDRTPHYRRKITVREKDMTHDIKVK